jgi:hypothetical protein
MRRFFTSPFFTPPSPNPLPPVGVRGALKRAANLVTSLRLRFQWSSVRECDIAVKSIAIIYIFGATQSNWLSALKLPLPRRGVRGWGMGE